MIQFCVVILAFFLFLLLIGGWTPAFVFLGATFITVAVYPQGINNKEK